MNGLKRSWRRAALTSRGFRANSVATAAFAIARSIAGYGLVTGKDDPLRLRASDLEDLSVIGMMVQDALVPPGDMRYLKDSGQFLLLLNRFRWETSDAGPPYARSHAGLRFDQVLSVQFKGIAWNAPEKMLSLLTIAFDPAGSDGAVVVLHFSGEAAVRLTVSSLACGLEDVGQPWPTQWMPEHAPG